MTDFDPAWPHGHCTRDGRKARIICTDRQSGSKGDYPLVGLIGQSDGFEVALFYRADGTLVDGDSILDVVNASPAAPPKIERWLTIGEGQDGSSQGLCWDTREAAESHMRSCRSAGRTARIVHLVESDE